LSRPEGPSAFIFSGVLSARRCMLFLWPCLDTQEPHEQLSNSLTDMGDIAEPPSSPLGATDSTDDSDEVEDEDSEMDDWELRHPQSFDPHALWCEECNSANPSDCPLHGPLHPIPNRPVLSKARASLPQILYIDRFLGGVFSKRRIPKRTQFGPVEGALVPQSELQDHYFQLKNHLEQNLVAYQYGSEIFYTTIKHIQPKQELKNGLKEVDMEPEGDAGTEDEGPLEPPTEEPLLQSETPSANTDLPVSLKEDLAQSSQPESHLTSQDMHRAKKIRVRLQTLFLLKSPRF
ncbi:hypothetical protein XENOCAPTIV_009358, partial [Xenoophorus captivus]